VRGQLTPGRRQCELAKLIEICMDTFVRSRHIVLIRGDYKTKRPAVKVNLIMRVRSFNSRADQDSNAWMQTENPSSCFSMETA
jgi:hypothetical protein